MTNTAGEGDDVNVLPANLQPARETEHTATGSAEETEQEKEEQVSNALGNLSRRAAGRPSGAAS